MNSIDAFERIFVINLPQRADRRTEIAEQLALVGLSFGSPNVRLFSAVRPDEPGGFDSIGARGCFMSHLEVLRQATSLRNVLILEDDLDFVPGIDGLFRLVLQALPAAWDVFYGGCVIDLPRGNGPLTRVLPSTPLRTSHFVAFNGTVIGRLVDHLEAILRRPPGHIDGGPMHVDGAYSRFRANNPDIAVFAAIPELGYQRPSRTDIHSLRWFDRAPFVKELIQLIRRQRAVKKRKSAVKAQVPDQSSD